MEFVVHNEKMQNLLEHIVKDNTLHAKWLNTLSYLENCGARKIASCEHPTLVKEEMLKHAAEEFRHAHYLKQQIAKVTHKPIDNYSLDAILGGIASLHYLHSLDIKTSRYLKKTAGMHGAALKAASYLLVTYAIEMRASALYPLYHELLKKYGSKVTVKSILLEEEEHLAEMIKGLEDMPDGQTHRQAVCALERELCGKWIQQIEKELIYAVYCTKNAFLVKNLVFNQNLSPL